MSEERTMAVTGASQDDPFKDLAYLWKAWLAAAGPWSNATKARSEQETVPGADDALTQLTQQALAVQRQLFTLFTNPAGAAAEAGEGQAAFAPFQAMFELWRQQAGGAAAGGAVVESMEKWREQAAQLWQQTASPWMLAIQPWSAAAGQFPWPFTGGVPNFGIADKVGELVNHPALIGNPQALERLVQQAFQSWLELQRASTEHQLVVAKGWQGAFARFGAEFQDRGGNDAEEVRTLDQFLRLWARIGERALQEHARSDGFLESQTRLLRAAMTYRSNQRRVVEALARMHDLPTQSDLDEAFKMIHELRREVRQLRMERKLLTGKNGAGAKDNE
jgi:class III poly(R)-hydroxyalkanoic acid synthase PhaE subunit